MRNWLGQYPAVAVDRCSAVSRQELREREVGYELEDVEGEEVVDVDGVLAGLFELESDVLELASLGFAWDSVLAPSFFSVLVSVPSFFSVDCPGALSLSE